MAKAAVAVVDAVLAATVLVARAAMPPASRELPASVRTAARVRVVTDALHAGLETRTARVLLARIFPPDISPWIRRLAR